MRKWFWLVIVSLLLMPAAALAQDDATTRGQALFEDGEYEAAVEAFTEALAFMFQARNLDLLGFKGADPNKDYLASLDTFWSVYESIGVSLVDMYIWKWMYENPSASPAPWAGGRTTSPSTPLP